MKHQGVDRAFSKSLLQKFGPSIAVVVLIGLLYILVDHFGLLNMAQMRMLILVAVFAKVIIISRLVVRKLGSLIVRCHVLEELLWVFGILISLTLMSFAIDYTFLDAIDGLAFQGSPEHSIPENLIHFLYHSVVTFTTLGYGDILPSSLLARVIVMMEMFMSFFVITFSLANIDKIHIDRTADED